MTNMIEVLQDALEIHIDALKKATANNDVDRQHRLLFSISMIRDSLNDIYKDNHMYNRRKK